MNNRTTITIALLAVVMTLGTANAVNVAAVCDSDENNSVSPCESCSRYQANDTLSEECANDMYAENGSGGNITNLTGSVCVDEVPIVNITSPVGMNESTVDRSVTNDNTTVATAVIRDGAVVNGTASSASPASEGMHISSNAEIAHSAIHEYSGAANCRVCHRDPEKGFVTSIHNTWQGIATNITGKGGNMTGKRVGVNEFCGAITSNEAMCGKCHAGFGLPEGNISVDKIDCLICHAPNYKKTATGPDPSITISEVTPGIRLPTREYCLRCHATAGGGDNRKRGDLELAMGASSVSKDLDVHMSANMTCQNCHIFDDEHHVSGRGMDLRVDDTDTIVSCEQCHQGEIHDGSMYNQHTDRIACTACHITSYGKVEPAEVARNWELPFLPGMLTKESNATPIHVWWNRTSEIMDLADPVVLDDGVVVMAKPGGDINDSESKIYAARLHLGRSPWNGTYMLPFNVPTAKATNNMTTAIFNATGEMYNPVQYVNATRYMGLFHGVSPKEDALTCNDCHKDHKLDYEALGYNVKKDASGNLTSATKPGSTLNLLDFGEGGHKLLIDEYNGSKTCLACHVEHGDDFVTSIHNTWMGTETGKLVGVNDFCGAVTSNEAMCGKCHAGYGLPDDLSVGKIDCLICHAPNYNKTATGPGPSINATAAAQGVELPTREYCLRCHAMAGGGDNRKRGDLELAMSVSNVSRDLDVHMSANMTCQDCHTFEDHHVSGRGMDLRVDDTDTIVSCEGCHNVSEPPHPEGSMYNQHTGRISCTACHITSYGKVTPAEVARNWVPPYSSDMLTKESNATPIHVWWNRTSEIMDLADRAVFDSDGNVVMAKPGGDINDSESKIYAARLHLGRQPWDGTYMLPFNVPTAKATNNMTEAIFNATGVTYNPVQYINTTRYMGLFHGVSPKEDALTCDDCHKDHKLDYEALGYNVKKDASGNLTSATKPGSTLNLLDFGGGGHAIFIDEYNGSETCLACHEEQGENFSTSIHNTWMGIATNITGKEGNTTGKRVGVNEFCGAVTSNEAMCGKCHAGYGLPEGDISVGKIDCLICHAPNYNKTATGPGPLVNATAAAQGVELPTREYCLRCHAMAGGDNNRKRGDLELAMGAADVSEDLDVHMSADMTCQDCHTFEDHHVSGRGMDLRVDDTTTVVSCDDAECHSSGPHPEGSLYNLHTDNLSCTACHITSYGKVEPVEVARNWELTFSSGMLTKESKPAPIHVWWNRTSEIMDLADRAVFDSDGNVVMAKPGGDINDSESKIYAARLHRGRSPWNGTYMLPFNVLTAKATKNMTEAIFNATGEIYDPVQYVNATRYMGLFHGVSPKEDALTCVDCHKDHKLNYTALGYNVKTDASGNLISATKPGIAWNLATLASGSGEEAEVAIRGLPTAVSETEIFTVTINTSDYGASAQVNETLPSGFEYISSSLDSSQVTSMGGNVVRFNLTGETSFTYIVNASGTPGIYDFSGTITNASDVVTDIGGDSSIVVGAAPIAEINDWTLHSTGTRGTIITSATVNIKNTGTETTWFTVSISGMQTTTGCPIGGVGMVQLNAGDSIDASVMIVVPGSSDTGDYTLIPAVYKQEDYLAGDSQAIGSGKSVTIS